MTVTQNGPDDCPGRDASPIRCRQNIGPNVTATTSIQGVTPTISGNTVTADFGAMAANSSATLTITVVPTAAAIPQITDQATVTSQGSDDPNPNNNTASLTTTIDPSADLALPLAGSPGTVTVGDTVTYTLTATNSGPSDADDVVVTDTLPLDITSSVTATHIGCGGDADDRQRPGHGRPGHARRGATATVTITVVPDAAAVPEISRQRLDFQQHV